MRRLLNEKFLYKGNSYFIKDVVGNVSPFLCDSCPFNKVGLVDCVSTEIIDCHCHCKIVKSD